MSRNPRMNPNRNTENSQDLDTVPSASQDFDPAQSEADIVCTGSCVGSLRWRMTSPGWDPLLGFMIVNACFAVMFIALYVFKRHLARNHPRVKGTASTWRWRKLDYEWTVWVIYFVVTSVAVADRFSYNVWPRQTMQIGVGDANGNRDAGSDFLVGFKPGPWSVVFFDIMARVTGRVSITALNLLLITRFQSLAHFLTTCWPRHLLDTADIVNANLRLHRWNGIMLCVATLVHVWSILFPTFFNKWHVQVVQGSFEFPLSERKLVGQSSVDYAARTVSLQVPPALSSSLM
mmetsp:Transcript_13157/g.27877  ORF Transcript_13157/g.27877 Transcript_13157/m.27877 type:complete len:290 (+) Transcript_13157:93-962(+)